jgi:hypothetical protein
MNSNENQDNSNTVTRSSDNKPMSIWTKLFVGTSALVGAGAGVLVSELTSIGGLALAAVYSRYDEGAARSFIESKTPPRRFIPNFIPKGALFGAMTGGAVGYGATVLFGKGYEIVRSAVSAVPDQKNVDTKQVQSKPFK